MIRKIPLNTNSLLFAPMEGITDELYREVIFKLYPEWDMFATDFLRVPTQGEYPVKHIIKHLGRFHYENGDSFNKTIYQILTPPESSLIATLRDLKKIKVSWLDLNLGCPSKTVCKNKGGSFLLSDINLLRKVVSSIRQLWDEIFTVKIRVGYRDDLLFKEIIKTLESCQVDAITVHARTRDELYKGVANWDYIKLATHLSKNTSIIGNGDIWTTEDIDKHFEYTKCHSIMIARGALKTPWLASLYKNREKDSEERRRFEIKRYFNFYNQLLIENNFDCEVKRMRRIKAISRYIFDDLKNSAPLKTSVLRSKGQSELFSIINQLY